MNKIDNINEWGINNNRAPDIIYIYIHVHVCIDMVKSAYVNLRFKINQPNELCKKIKEITKKYGRCSGRVFYIDEYDKTIEYHLFAFVTNGKGNLSTTDWSGRAIKHGYI